MSDYTHAPKPCQCCDDLPEVRAELAEEKIKNTHLSRELTAARMPRPRADLAEAIRRVNIGIQTIEQGVKKHGTTMFWDYRRALDGLTWAAGALHLVSAELAAAREREEVLRTSIQFSLDHARDMADVYKDRFLNAFDEVAVLTTDRRAEPMPVPRWEDFWERDKAAVGRAAHEVWLARIADASPLGHLPKRDSRGLFSEELRDVPIEHQHVLGEKIKIFACLTCGQDASLHMPRRGAPRVAYQDAYCLEWDLLEPDQRATIIDAVSGRERFRLGWEAALAAGRGEPADPQRPFHDLLMGRLQDYHRDYRHRGSWVECLDSPCPEMWAAFVALKSLERG